MQTVSQKYSSCAFSLQKTKISRKFIVLSANEKVLPLINGDDYDQCIDGMMKGFQDADNPPPPHTLCPRHTSTGLLIQYNLVMISHLH